MRKGDNSIGQNFEHATDKYACSSRPDCNVSGAASNFPLRSVLADITSEILAYFELFALV